MNTLDKRIFRDLKLNLGKYLSIFILLTTTIAFGSAFLIVSDSIEKTLYNNQLTANIEDGNFTLEEYYDFSNTEINIEENFYIDIENNYTLRIYKVRDKINTLSLFNGKIATDTNEISIDRVFANSNNIKLNNYINDLKVVGLISVPDYNSLFKSNTDLMMNTKNFGIGFVNSNTFSLLASKYNVKYNYSYKGNIDDIREYLIKNKLRISSIITADKNQSITFLTDDMSSDVPAMKVLIYIVVIIIAFVFVILSLNNIESDSKSIGTLKALGYKKIEIVYHYIKLPILVTIIAAIIGNILGYTLLIEPFKNLYYTTYSLPPLHLELNSEAFLLTTIIPIIIMILVNYFMLSNKLKNKTVDFLKGSIKKNRTRNIILPKSISFKNRFRLRIIIDNIGNFIILFLGIFLASLILLFSIGLKPVIDNYKDTITKTTVSEYQYILSSPIEFDGYKLTNYQMSTYYKFGKKDYTINFMGLSNTDEYFKDLSLKDLEDGIVISDSLALKMNINIGDVIIFKDNNLNKNYKYKVLDIYKYRAGFTVFVKKSDLNKLLGYDNSYYNSILSQEKLDIDNKYIVKEIARKDIAGVADQLMASFENLLNMVTIFGVVIYLVLMYVLTKVIIENASLNISLMKIIGYERKEIYNLMLRGITIFVILLLILVLPIEYFVVANLFTYAMIMVEGYFEILIPISIYVFVAVIGIITYLLINGLHISKINKISMIDILKDRE